ncbi:MAG: response regulator [Chloroflexaceae bacterium]|nr:response regulator [Chloroflexaceae bacterium]
MNPTQPGETRGSILIVDDEPVNLRLLAIMLNEHGYVVRTAMKGSLALQSVQMDPPDIILLDIAMPEMDGYEVCHHLKSNERTCSIPVIFISAFDDIASKIEAFRAGGVDYITKPFRIEEVLARVVTHLAVRTMHQQLQEQNTLLQQEIGERQRTEEALRQSSRELDRRVQERTAELTRANAALQKEIEEREQREREREAIISVASALRVASSRSEMIAILLEQVAELLHAEGVLLLAPFAGGVEVEQGYGRWKETSGWHTITDPEGSEPEAAGGLGQLFDNGDPLLISEGSAVHVPVVGSLPLPGPLPAMVFVPLMVESQTIGVLGVGCRHPVCNNDRRILSAIGDMAASALHRTQLHEQTRRRLERIQALHTIDQTITTSLNLRVTLNVLIFQVSSQLEADASAVLLFNPDTHHLEHATSQGFRTTSIQQSCMRLGEGLAGRTAMEQGFVHIPDVRVAETECVRPAMLREEGFVSYYGVPLIARGRIKGVLEIFHRSMLKPDQEWLEFLGTLAGQASIAIDNADMFAQLQRSNTDLSRAYDATIEGWARALELRDAETEGHCRRVTDLTIQLARRMGFSDEDIVHIRRGAILHDIGKMAIPDAILLKAGPLTREERTVMQQHTVYAYKLLSPIPFLRSALDIPYCHHEKWDGTGYPRGLKGEDIPLTARIFAVVDVWDALRSDRPIARGGRKKMSAPICWTTPAPILTRRWSRFFFL